jgi:hypothetical protein
LDRYSWVAERTFFPACPRKKRTTARVCRNVRQAEELFRGTSADVESTAYKRAVSIAVKNGFISPRKTGSTKIRPQKGLIYRKSGQNKLKWGSRESIAEKSSLIISKTVLPAEIRP